jgi:hypothetical protein
LGTPVIMVLVPFHGVPITVSEKRIIDIREFSSTI